MNLPTDASIAWEDTHTGSVNLLRTPVVNNKKIPFFTPSYGQLMCPPGWRKLSKNALSSAYLMYEINNLPETQPPQLTGDEPQVIKDQILNNYYWNSPQYRMELFSSSDSGANWVRRSKLPLMRPTGFPEGTINLLASLNNVVLSFKSTDRLAIAFRDVGFGLPSVSSDNMTVTTTQEIPQLIYPFAPLTREPPETIIFERVTSAVAATAGAWQTLVPANPLRNTMQFSTSQVFLSTTVEVRYGAANLPSGVVQTVERTGNTLAMADYLGEVAFRYSSITPRPIMTAIEQQF